MLSEYIKVLLNCGQTLVVQHLRTVISVRNDPHWYLSTVLVRDVEWKHRGVVCGLP